jgi:O-antigen biosynthesis protein
VSERAAVPVPVDIRLDVRGKFIYLGENKFYVRGATYGTFRPAVGGDHQYRDPGVVERDFALMAANGLNAVRTYTVPPRWLLDAARRHGLYVMVGLPCEQHVSFLDKGRRARSIADRVRAGVRACAGHPAVLCYVIGSEIPAPIVRWYGPRRIERYLERSYYAAAKLLPGLTVLAPAQRSASTNSTSCSIGNLLDCREMRLTQLSLYAADATLAERADEELAGFGER